MDSALRDEEVVTVETEKEGEQMKMDPDHLYETAGNHETTSNSELPYQEVFTTETVNQASHEMDPWMVGIKETLMVSACNAFVE